MNNIKRFPFFKNDSNIEEHLTEVINLHRDDSKKVENLIIIFQDSYGTIDYAIHGDIRKTQQVGLIEIVKQHILDSIKKYD